MRSILSLGLVTAAALAPAACFAHTSVAILEFGSGGTVRRTTASTIESTAAGVGSFWNVMHRRTKRSAQHAGMSVVPDLFNRADAGVVVGISGSSSDLTLMPTALSLLTNKVSADVVGLINVHGQVGNELMKRASPKNVVVSLSEKSTFDSSLQSASKKASGGIDGIETLSLVVENDAAATEADESLRRMLYDLKKRAADSGKTVVMHLVVEEEESAARRKLASSTHRSLDEENNNDNGDNQNNNDNNYNPSYYEGRYGAVGGKTMFQIQTFNIFLWTAIGLFVILSMAVGMFINMPLMADTLLFGEAVKVGAD